jgi:glyoxylase-like metal-dependent hydrolase (beta-lactamase superfamily II)
MRKQQRIYFWGKVAACCFSVLLLAACGDQEGSAGSTVQSASENLLSTGVNAMGGVEALRNDAIINVTIQGLSFEPHEDGPEIDVFENLTSKYTSYLTTMLSGEKLNIEYRTEFVYPYPYTGGATMIIDGKEGSVHGIDSFQSRFFGLTVPRPMYSRRLEAISKTQLMGNPYMLMGRIIDQSGVDAKAVDGAYELSLAEDFPPIRVELDSSTGLPVRASTIERDHLFGDVVYQVEFNDWQVVEGGTYPRVIDHNLDGFTLRAETVTDVSFGDHKVDELTFAITSKPSTYVNIENPYIIVEAYDPVEGRRGLEASQWSMRMISVGFSQDLPVDAVVITKENTSRNRDINVGGNVYMVEGDTELMAYASVVVDMVDGIYVIEPVLHSYRSEVAIEAIKEKFPGKPLLGIVATHHHMDHLGGLRAFAAETGKVFIGAGGADFVNKSLATKNTIFPDALDRHEGEVEVVAVAENMTLGEGDEAFELLNYSTPHTEDMLLIYFPAIKALVVGDILNGEMVDALRFYNPNIKEILGRRAKALNDFIISNDLDVETLLTIHGGAVSANEIKAYL